MRAVHLSAAPYSCSSRTVARAERLRQPHLRCPGPAAVAFVLTPCLTQFPALLLCLRIMLYTHWCSLQAHRHPSSPTALQPLAGQHSGLPVKSA
jgi:hypothetical protein